MEQASPSLKVKASIWIVALVAALLALVLGLLWPHTTVHAANDHIVTIYHDGEQQIVASDATTVGDVLKRADITLNPHDIVEPSQTTQLVAADYSVNVYRARPVTVVDGENRYHIMTAHTSAKQIAEDAGLTIYDEDILQLSRIDDFVAEQSVGLILTVTPSVPVKAVLYDKPVDMRTQAKTVQGFLDEKGIVLHDGDKLWPAADTLITPDLAIAVYRNGSQAVQEEAIPFATQTIRDADHDVGYREVKEAGAAGKRFVIYQIETQNGKEVRTELQSIIIAQPKTQVEVVGTKSAGFGGDFADALARLRSCEGHYTSVNDRALDPANWYYGAYQFNLTTWRGAAPAGYADVRPDQAPPAAQDEAAHNLYMRRGWQPWPVCSVKEGLQDIYR